MAAAMRAISLRSFARVSTLRAVHMHVRKPFRFLLCGDPALVAELRSLLLTGHDESVPPEAAACLETIRSDAPKRNQPQRSPRSDLSRPAVATRRTRISAR